MDEKGKKLKNIMQCCFLLPSAAFGVCAAAALGSYTAPDAVPVMEKQYDKTIEYTETSCPQTTAAPSVTSTSATEAFAESGSYKDGTYTGTGTGFAGEIVVAVEIKNGKINDISVVSSGDDAAYLKAASTLLDAIKKEQTTNVDTVSGATYSSVGLIQAVRDALKKAGGSGEEESALPVLSHSGSSGSRGPVSISSVSEPSEYRDGTYTGTGTGFSGPLTVKVVVANGRIANVSLVSSGDDSPYIDRASALLGKIVSANSTNVDAVTGATYSSAGIIQAVRNALSKASGVTTTVQNTTESSDNSGDAVFPCQDGVYIGTGEGYRGEIQAAVSLRNGRIDTILILSSEDDEEFFRRAENALLPEIIKNQSVSADAVTGATFSSEGIMEAVSNALKSAQETSQGTKPQSTATSVTTTVTTTITETSEHTGTAKTDNTEEALFRDGTYTAAVICYPDSSDDFSEYTLRLTVRTEGGRIVEIRDITGEGGEYDTENDWYISRAANGTGRLKGVLSQIIDRQTADGIDAVSGATCSSQAIIKAVADALKKAGI